MGINLNESQVYEGCKATRRSEKMKRERKRERERESEEGVERIKSALASTSVCEEFDCACVGESLSSLFP